MLRTCGKALDVEKGRLILFPGNVESYLAFKEEQKEQAIRYNKNVEAKRRHLQEFVSPGAVPAEPFAKSRSQ